MTTQYAVPTTMACSEHRRLESPVCNVKATPPQGRMPGDAPIVQSYTLVRATLLCGCVRHFGVERAWIGSDLRMHVEGGFINPRNELARGWSLKSP